MMMVVCVCVCVFMFIREGFVLNLFSDIESIHGLKYNEIFMAPRSEVVKGFEYITPEPEMWD